MKLFNILLFTGSLMLSTSAWSLTIDEAKQQGRVGETISGYLAPIKQDRETLEFVTTINNARLEKYKEIATKNNTTVTDVANITGQKLLERAKSGEYLRGINGQWVKK